MFRHSLFLLCSAFLIVSTGSVLAQNNPQPPACLVVPPGAQLAYSRRCEPNESCRFVFSFAVLNMSVAFDDVIRQLEQRNLHLGREVSAMGDGSSIFYPCNGLTAIVQAAGSVSSSGNMQVILGTQGE